MMNISIDDVKAVLIAARKLIENEDNWCTEFFARTADGTAICSTEPEAVKWCAYGALNKVSATSSITVHEGALNRLNSYTHEHGLPVLSKLNDTQGHAAVLDVYDKVIESIK